MREPTAVSPSRHLCSKGAQSADIRSTIHIAVLSKDVVEQCTLLLRSFQERYETFDPSEDLIKGQDAYTDQTLSKAFKRTTLRICIQLLCCIANNHQAVRFSRRKAFIATVQRVELCEQ